MANENGPSMEEIGYFRVTSRNGPEILSQCQLEQQDIQNLLPNSTILEVGSGLNQELAKHLKTIRPDITTVSLDPTLGITVYQQRFFIETSADGKQLEYKLSQGLTPEQKDQTTAVQNQRIKTAEENSIAALAQSLPFKDNAFDLIIDSFGPGTWFCNKPETTQRYVSELCRVLKPNGLAIIFPVDNWKEYVFSENDEQRNQEAKQRFLSSLQQLNSSGEIKIEFYQQVNTGKNIRIGAKITKNPHDK